MGDPPGGDDNRLFRGRGDRVAVPDEGGAGELLVRAAKGADLLVVGSRGRGEFAALLGSVGLYCALNAHCPVLILRDGYSKHRAAA